MIPYKIMNIPNMPPQAMQLNKTLVTLRTLVIATLFVDCFDVSEEVVTTAETGGHTVR